MRILLAIVKPVCNKIVKLSFSIQEVILAEEYFCWGNGIGQGRNLSLLTTFPIQLTTAMRNCSGSYSSGTTLLHSEQLFDALHLMIVSI